jgi:predicted HTH domain antitoxin
MTLKIPDELLEAAGLDERELLIELACHLFDTDRLELNQATRFANLERADFEDELHRRGIAIYRYGPEELEQDAEAVAKMRRQGL